MGSSVNSSGIDDTKPTSGTATTLSVRDNFAEIKTQFDNTKTDLDSLFATLGGLDWQPSVLTQQNTEAAQGAGDRYLIGPSPTGAWVGHANEIAESDGAVWSYTVPTEGTAVNVEGTNLDGNTDVAMIYNGTTWENFGSAVHHEALQGLLGGAADDHYHLTGQQHTDLLAHLTDTANPHAVTKSQVGLGNVPNTDATVAANIAIVDAGANYAATDVEAALAEEADARQTHEGDTTNPHAVTKSQVGLGNVPNTDATVAANVAIVDAGGNYTATDVEAALAEEADARQTHEGDTTNPHAVTKSQVGLGNVPNTDATVAANIAIVDAGANYAATDVEAALAEEADARQTHEGDTTNPHSVTAAQVGLGNVGNYEQAARYVTFNTRTANYTLVLSDADDEVVEMNLAGANNLTVPANASVPYPIGTQIPVAQLGAGQTTIVEDTGVTVRTSETLKLRAQNSWATLIKRATNEWYLVGDLEAA